jgi:hypothetical protein
MKATITLLTALVVSTITFSTARAQYPIQPIEPAGFGGKVAQGGCADGSCGGSTDGSCGKTGLFAKLGLHGGCKGGGCGAGGCGTGLCSHKCLNWLCRPLPSNAPSCHSPDYPLGFPNSPYVRSPRDYFLDP